MALDPPFVVHVEKAHETLFSKYFAEMRIWLDAHKIEPVDFRLLSGPCIGLDVRFASPEEASLFERAFGVEAQLTNLSPGFAARAASQASMTRTMPVIDQSVSDTPAAITVGDPQALMEA